MARVTYLVIVVFAVGFVMGRWVGVVCPTSGSRKVFRSDPEGALPAPTRQTSLSPPTQAVLPAPVPVQQTPHRAAAFDKRGNELPVEEQTRLLIELLYEPVPLGVCRTSVTWGGEGDGAWVLCGDAEPKPPCAVLSVGVAGLPQFESAAAQKGCAVHSFDHTIKQAPGGYPSTGVLHYKGLGPEDTGDLLSLQSMFRELTGDDSSRVDVLKIDCEGCEWDVFHAIDTRTSDGGLAMFDRVEQVLIEVHIGTNWGWSHEKGASLISVLRRAGFEPFYRHFNPWSLAAMGTESVFQLMKNGKFGDEVHKFEATYENMVGTFGVEHHHLWQRHETPGALRCCFELGFVRRP